MPQYKSNVLIKFKNEPIPRVRSDYAKYKNLHYQSWNLFEIYQNKISKLSEDEQNNLRTKFYEIFYYEDNYIQTQEKNRDYLYFKSVENDKIIQELSELAEMFPELELNGGQLTADLEQDGNESTLFHIEIKNGKVTVLV